VRNWPRVAPGEPATEPNSWIAAKSDSRMQAAAAFKPIMDIQIVSDAQPRDSLIGMPVEIAAAFVRSVPDAGGFWASQERTPVIFVAFGPDAKRVPLRSGALVTFRGKVQALPGEDAIRSRWPGLSADDLERLQSQLVYVEASEVEAH
jgi:hypothetical protein